MIIERKKREVKGYGRKEQEKGRRKEKSCVV